jgi:hypothetical protein
MIDKPGELVLTAGPTRRRSRGTHPRMLPGCGGVVVPCAAGAAPGSVWYLTSDECPIPQQFLRDGGWRSVRNLEGTVTTAEHCDQTPPAEKNFDALDVLGRVGRKWTANVVAARHRNAALHRAPALGGGDHSTVAHRHVAGPRARLRHRPPFLPQHPATRRVHPHRPRRVPARRRARAHRSERRTLRRHPGSAQALRRGPRRPAKPSRKANKSPPPTRHRTGTAARPWAGCRGAPRGPTAIPATGNP